MTSFLFGNVADRLVPVLQTPVEDIIYEVLDQKGFPTRQEVRELRNKLDRLEKSLGNLTTALESLQTDVEQAGAAAADAVERASHASDAPAPVAAPAPTVAKATGKKICKVDGCDSPVRARGFCGKHYQKWKRSTLPGYVGADGTTEHEAVKYVVGEDVAGQVVETRYEGDEVIFLLPESGGRVIRAKVDDVRRYD